MSPGSSKLALSVSRAANSLTTGNWSLRRLVPWAAEWALLIALLLWPTLLNGYVLVMTDSQAYVETSYLLTPSINWPMGYGILIWLVRLIIRYNTLLPFVGLQVAFVAAIWMRALRVFASALPFAGRCVVYLALATTSLPWHADQCMTDVLFPTAGLMLLMAIRPSPLRPVERALHSTGVIIISTTHYALPPILTVASAGFACILALRKQLDLRRAALLPGTVLLAWLTTPVIHRLASGKTTYAASTPHNLAAKLYSLGLVERFAREHCPDPHLQLCSFKGPLVGELGNYVWGMALMNHLGGWDAAGPVEMELVRRIAREYPLQVVSGMIRDALRQTTRFSVAFLPPIADENTIDYTLKRRMPRDYALFSRSRQQKGTLPLEAVARASLFIYVMSFAIICVAFVSGLRRRMNLTDNEFGVISSIVVFLLANDLTAGGIGEPTDRYGSRVMPLLVVAAAIAVAKWWGDRRCQVSPV